MTKMSIGEFEAYPGQAVALIDAGITVEVTRDGKVIAELKPKAEEPDPGRRLAALQRIRAVIGPGTAFGRKFSYEERTT